VQYRNTSALSNKVGGPLTLPERSLEVAKAQREAALGTELAVQRYLAEVRKNQSEKLIVRNREKIT
jgi:hypothetical protein